MLKTLAILFGLLFVVGGCLGFVPSAMQDGDLFGIFHVNAIHNLVHILTGLVALWVAFTGSHATKLFFQIFGIIYGIVAILGFFYGNEDIFGLIANNTADIWLHLGIAVVSLTVGFGLSEE